MEGQAKSAAYLTSTCFPQELPQALCGNQQMTVDRRKGKRHGQPAEQASPVAHIFIRQVLLPSTACHCSLAAMFGMAVGTKRRGSHVSCK